MSKEWCKFEKPSIYTWLLTNSDRFLSVFPKTGEILFLLPSLFMRLLRVNTRIFLNTQTLQSQRIVYKLLVYYLYLLFSFAGVFTGQCIFRTFEGVVTAYFRFDWNKFAQSGFAEVGLAPMKFALRGINLLIIFTWNVCQIINYNTYYIK